MKLLNQKNFINGDVYAYEVAGGYPIEVTDTFLPYYTKFANELNTNMLEQDNQYYGNRSERHMIGVSCMSGCPVKCGFCSTGSLKRCRNLTFGEIINQVEMMIEKYGYKPENSKEFKINYTRMGEPFLNIDAVKWAITYLDSKYNDIHHYVSTIGIKGSDFSWIKGDITLQISLHSLDEERRNSLILFKNKMSIEELGQIRTDSYLKTTVNLTLVDKEDFDIDVLKKYFDPEYFDYECVYINSGYLFESCLKWKEDYEQ